MTRTDELIENAFAIMMNLCRNPKALEVTPFALVQQSFVLAREFMNAAEDLEAQSTDAYR